jgi:hypothetical protein
LFGQVLDRERIVTKWSALAIKVLLAAHKSVSKAGYSGVDRPRGRRRRRACGSISLALRVDSSEIHRRALQSRTGPVYQACVEAFYYSEGYEAEETITISRISFPNTHRRRLGAVLEKRRATRAIGVLSDLSLQRISL